MPRRPGRGVRALAATLLIAVAAGLIAPSEGRAAYLFSSHTFTPCGATLSTGPTSAQCAVAYGSAAWASSPANFNVSSGIQLWTVPSTGLYRITAAGAKGGGALGANGRVVAANLNLTEGDVIKILVGQTGASSGNTGGGGGGSFVATNANAALVVAVGGGGGGNSNAGNVAPATEIGRAHV